VLKLLAPPLPSPHEWGLELINRILILLMDDDNIYREFLGILLHNMGSKCYKLEGVPLIKSVAETAC
jgi:hypothetical protein